MRGYFYKTSRTLSTLSLLLAVVACSAGDSSVASVACKTSTSAASLLDILPPQGLQLESPQTNGFTGMQGFRGFIDFAWNENNTQQKKRCVMNMIPSVADSKKVKVFTAGHCIPFFDSPVNTNLVVTGHVYHNNGYIPLALAIPQGEKIMMTTAFLKKYLVPQLNDYEIGLLLPEYATSQCEKWTRRFKEGSVGSHKTACFSRQDLRIIDVEIKEQDARRLAQYAAAYTDLNRIKGEALSDLSREVGEGLMNLWRFHNVDDMRKRNLRAFAFLTNTNFCTSTVSVVNPKGESVSRFFCKTSASVRDSFFRYSATDSEYQRLMTIRNDTTTPLQELHDRYLGCERNASSAADEYTSCEINAVAREFFDKWVRDAESAFAAVPDTAKRGLSFADYFRVVTPENASTGKYNMSVLSLSTNISRSSMNDDAFRGGFLFDYDPAKNYFTFEKGNSGTALNMLSGFPVAVLSTIDGEPTSGGASVTPLPEPKDEAGSTSSSTTACK